MLGLGLGGANIGALIGQIGWHRPGNKAAVGGVLALLIYFALVVWAYAGEAQRRPYAGDHRKD
jgi:hypothetical protein